MIRLISRSSRWTTCMYTLLLFDKRSKIKVKRHKKTAPARVFALLWVLASSSYYLSYFIIFLNQ